MCSPACFIFTVWLIALLVYPGVPARSGESYLKDNITVRQGDSAVLKCNVDNKVSRVAWLNRTTILFTGNEKWSLDPRVVLLNTAVTEYSIKIINVNLYDEGPYVCSILTNKKPESTKVHLIVQVPARIVNISTDVSVNEGSNVSLMCLAIGRPEPSIFWKFRSSKGDGKGNRIITEGEYVEMTGITKDMSGSYDCITSNDISPPDVRTVQVTVNYPPVISRARSTGTAVGQKGVLWCEASAIPLADFQWYKGERRPRSDTRREQRSLIANQLILASDSRFNSFSPLQVLMLKQRVRFSVYTQTHSPTHREEEYFISYYYRHHHLNYFALYFVSEGKCQCGFMGL
uniref:Opioid binding protein/cell adhesion molecule-like n=1 Tax=Cyprinus carpio TaxID=7962 RepID=A0A8C1VHH1_CYPCA